MGNVWRITQVPLHPAYRATMGCFAFPPRKGVPRHIYRSKTTRLDGIGLLSFIFSSPYFLLLCLLFPFDFGNSSRALERSNGQNLIDLYDFAISRR